MFLALPSSVPSNLRSKAATLNMITMEWDVVKDFSKERITGYQCQLLESGFLQNVAQSLAVNGTVSIQFFGLLPDSFYTFRVRAINPSGFGLWSSNIVAYTNLGILLKLSKETFFKFLFYLSHLHFYGILPFSLLFSLKFFFVVIYFFFGFLFRYNWRSHQCSFNTKTFL